MSVRQVVHCLEGEVREGLSEHDAERDCVKSVCVIALTHSLVDVVQRRRASSGASGRDLVTAKEERTRSGKAIQSGGQCGVVSR